MNRCTRVPAVHCVGVLRTAPAGRQARGDDAVESAFGLFKRAIIGSFHQASVKHIERYLDEFEYRFNNRKNPCLFRDMLVRLMDAKALPYETLTA